MTAAQFRRKSRRAMANPRTRPVKVGRFNVTSHAQNKMVERKIRNESMIENLCRKPAAKSPVKVDSNGPSYKRMNKDTTTTINPISKNVSTIYRTNSRDAKHYGFQKSPHLVRQGERASTTTGAKKTAIKTRTKRLV